jgi:hypothetical protein
MATFNYAAQGTLNRLRCAIVIPEFFQLNVDAQHMSKSFATLSFSGNFNDLIPTATGGVTSPEPYVMASITFGLLRSQALSSAWLAQAQLLGTLGPITIYPDSTVYPELSIFNCVIADYEPGAYDGNDPTVRVTIRGIFPINATLWADA